MTGDSLKCLASYYSLTYIKLVPGIFVHSIVRFSKLFFFFLRSGGELWPGHSYRLLELMTTLPSTRLIRDLRAPSSPQAATAGESQSLLPGCYFPPPLQAACLPNHVLSQGPGLPVGARGEVTFRKSAHTGAHHHLNRSQEV